MPPGDDGTITPPGPPQPEETVGEETFKRTARYNIYADENGELRWKLLAGNNRIIANSGEGYKNRSDVIRGIWMVQNSDKAQISTTLPTKRQVEELPSP